jgi:hypothetical protein
MKRRDGVTPRAFSVMDFDPFPTRAVSKGTPFDSPKEHPMLVSTAMAVLGGLFTLALVVEAILAWKDKGK